MISYSLNDDDFDCRLCIEINNFDNGLFAQQYPGFLKNNVFFETTHLQVMIPVGPFCEGHLLVAAKNHVLSFAHMEIKVISELSFLLDGLSTFLENRYGRIVAFEHGPMSKTRRGGCCLDHAHMNLIPVPESLDLYKAVSKFVDLRQTRLEELAAFVQMDEPYLFFRCAREGEFAAFAAEGTTQFFRKLIASETSEAAWDWRDNPKADIVQAMILMLNGHTQVAEQSKDQLS